MALPPHTPLLFLAAFVASSVGFFAWLFRDTPGARPLAGFMVAASLLALAEGIGLASPTHGGKVFWAQVAWTVSPVIPLAWLVTVLAYTEHRWRLTRRRLALLFVEPVAFVALVWTAESHGLVWADLSTVLTDGYLVLTREFGVAIWAHLGYSYLLIAVGATVLVQLNFRAERHFRSQYTVLLAAISIPVFASALSVFRVVPPHYDLTSIGFVVTGLLVTGAIFRGGLLAAAPATRDLGRETAVDEMDDQMLILDGRDRVVDLNPAAESLFGVSTTAAVGRPLAGVNESLAAAIRGVESGQVEFELDLGHSVDYYDVRVSTFDRAYGSTSGRVVSLREVTDRRRREQRLDVMNRLLRHNLRNEMNVVGGNAELLRNRVDDSPEAQKHLDHISETVDAILDRSEKIGRLARQAEQDTHRAVDLETAARDVASTVTESAPETEISVDVPDGLSVLCGESLELVVEELLTNAVEHSDGPGGSVDLSAERTGDGAVELRVGDDGPGIEPQERAVIEAGRETALEHGSGVGLWLVTWMVEEFGGTVGFEPREDGTTVVVRLPIEADEMVEPVDTAEAPDPTP